jgi:hypothetical protein
MVGSLQYVVTLTRERRKPQRVEVSARGPALAIKMAETLQPGWLAIEVGLPIAGHCGACKAIVFKGDESAHFFRGQLRCSDCP